MLDLDGVCAVIVAVLCVIHVIQPDGWVGTGHLSGGHDRCQCGRLAQRAPLRRIEPGLAGNRDQRVGVGRRPVRGVRRRQRTPCPTCRSPTRPWIASYVAVGVGMLQLLRRSHRRNRRDIDGLIDMAVIALIAVLVLWQFWIGPSVSDTIGAVVRAERVGVVSDPRRDSARGRAQDAPRAAYRVRRWGCFLAGGVALLADLRLHVPDRRPGGLRQRLLDVGWMAGAALLAAGCWRSSGPGDRRRTEHRSR